MGLLLCQQSLCSSLAGTQLPPCPKRNQHLHFHTMRISASKQRAVAHSPAVLCTSASIWQECVAGGGHCLVCESSVLFTAQGLESSPQVKSMQSLFPLCGIFSSHQLRHGSSSCLSAGTTALPQTLKSCSCRYKVPHATTLQLPLLSGAHQRGCLEQRWASPALLRAFPRCRCWETHTPAHLPSPLASC